MKTKVLEIRDEGTCIPALAIKMEATNAIEEKYLWRYGYPSDGHVIVLMHLSTQEANSDPYHWSGGRTMRAAHHWIIDNWDGLKDGDVVDVRVFAPAHLMDDADRRDTPAAPEIWTGNQA